jgi:hypothetical protein
MKKHVLTAIALAALAPAAMAVTYNDTITAIYGSGNPDTGWTSEFGNGIELALRGKNRDTGATPQPNTLGVYEFATGPAANPARAKWQYEFSINSGTPTLAFYDYYLSIDLDPSQGISYLTIDPILGYPDNSYGNSLTANGAGIEGLGLVLSPINFIAQNSQNIAFLGLDINADSTFNYALYAVAKGAGAGGSRLAEVEMVVVVGRGGAAVPDAGSTLALLGVGIAGLAAVRRKLA